jgi:putative Mg2+ transporter-C (MgtC) family protein
MLDYELHLLVQVGVAALLGGILGMEREWAGKEAGIRTNMLVAAGAAMFIGLGEILVHHFQSYDEQMQFDPTRLIEAVVTGVSFLGAGMIFVSGSRHRVHGLTTAASVWMTAAIGMAVGLDSYYLAVGATLLVVFVLLVLGFIENRFIERKKEEASHNDSDRKKSR